jgi:hypothetical protein
MSYSATYSPEDNKLRLRLVAPDAETYARVKAPLRVGPEQKLFVAPAWSPAREDLLIELAGEVGDEDTSLVERAEERAERFEDYQTARTDDAERARRGVAAIADNIPFGQPILVGHHSERHARKDAERIQNGMRRAVKMWETAQYWQDRAKGALRAAKYKERPDVRARRIKAEADAQAGQANRRGRVIRAPLVQGRNRRRLRQQKGWQRFDRYGARALRGQLFARLAMLSAGRLPARSASIAIRGSYFALERADRWHYHASAGDRNCHARPHQRRRTSRALERAPRKPPRL